MTATRRQCGPQARRTAEQIAVLHGLTLSEINDPAAKRRYARTRQHVMHALMATGRYSSTSVGRFLNRDHSTVLHGVRAHERRTGT